MKGLKVSLVIMAAALLTIGLSGMAYAFHSGGVAECAGCHSMHAPKAGGTFLLVGSDQSSTCLSCHEHAGDSGPSSYHISTALADMANPPKQRTPGGDFGWLRKDFTYTGEDGATSVTEKGQTHGHNIVALDNNYAADTDNAFSPGGNIFNSLNLACTSCHDPHGKFRRLNSGSIAKAGAPIKASGSYNGTANEPTATEAVGVYRLLRGMGEAAGSGTFPGNPAAKVSSTFNQSEPTSTTQVRVAYGVVSSTGHTTWGAWCATCHPNNHSNGGGNYVHPVDENLGSTIAQNYQQYIASGNMGGSSATSFSSLVPFVSGGASYSGLAALANNNGSNLSGPGTSDQVTCLSCHRSHASGWEFGLRWYNEYEFMTKGGKYIASDNGTTSGSRAGVQHRGRLEGDAQAAYYDRPATVFATYQRVLCNKCHAKD